MRKIYIQKLDYVDAYPVQGTSEADREEILEWVKEISHDRANPVGITLLGWRLKDSVSAGGSFSSTSFEFTIQHPHFPDSKQTIEVYNGDVLEHKGGGKFEVVDREEFFDKYMDADHLRRLLSHCDKSKYPTGE